MLVPFFRGSELLRATPSYSELLRITPSYSAKKSHSKNRARSAVRTETAPTAPMTFPKADPSVLHAEGDVPVLASG